MVFLPLVELSSLREEAGTLAEERRGVVPAVAPGVAPPVAPLAAQPPVAAGEVVLS